MIREKTKRNLVAIIGIWVLFSLSPFAAHAIEQQQPVTASEQLSSEQPAGDSTAAGYGAAAQESGIDYSNKTLSGWANDAREQSSVTKTKINELRQMLPSIPGQLRALWTQLIGELTVTAHLKFFGVIGLILAAAWLVEWKLGARLARFNYSFADKTGETVGEKFKHIVTRMLSAAILIGIFAVTAFVISAATLENGSSLQIALDHTLQGIVGFRVWRLLLRAVLAPTAPGIRMIDMDNDTAQGSLLRLSIFFGLLETVEASVNLLSTLGLTTLVLTGIGSLSYLIINGYFFWITWRARATITRMFVGSEAIDPDVHPIGHTLSRVWPLLVAAWILLLWSLWTLQAFNENWKATEELALAWWIIVLFPLVDRVLNSGLKRLVTLEWLHSKSFEKRSQRFIKIAQNGFRIIMLGISLYVLLNAWGVGVASGLNETLSSQAFANVLDIVVILIAAFVLWEVVHALVARKLPDEPEEGELTGPEGDGGGTGASRAETLLPLVRSTLLVVLSIFVILSVLHSLGIEIGPLLAGAGVVGIAVGFGAQKLVQDILSGIFFLVDDAFRRGEYIEVGEMRGTVEKISLRSMQLRHHLGAVQTIPYGEIKTVKNVSRDWVIMKLEFRLPYDADIEKVRKIVKKVGLAMMDDPEFGQDMLAPLKSQGVMRVEESALILRMKFTTRPGGQWLVRRAAYARVRDALSAAGINFAHREVRVRLPDELEQKIADSDNGELRKELPVIAGAAAAAAGTIIAAEAAGEQPPPDDSP